ncbi:MAG TPA: DUF4870 domain-containing protein [Euzebyales bacterium]|nr:DUF4870 domain-containing protein [Euzebyales bacterium]
MEQMRHESRPCAHCGGTIAPDDTTCATCGRAYIPEAEQQPAPPSAPPPAADPPGPLVSAPQPTVRSDDARMWAVGAHLSALAGVLLGGLPAFLGPLVVWLLRRDAGDPFATEHAREALNFNLSVIIYVIAAVVVTIFTLGLALLIVAPVALIAAIGYLVVTIRATIAASHGEEYTYPLAIRLVS